MANNPRRYEADDIVVIYDVKRCIHAAECVHGSAAVFNPERRPWIDPSLATAGRVAEVVVDCPTGALRFERRDSGPDEVRPPENVMRVTADGPLYLHGRVELTVPDVPQPVSETRLALCRCGESKNKPLCDNSHLESGFKDDGSLGEGRLMEIESAGEDLEISMAPNGPILVRGRLRLEGSTGAQSVSGTKGALCRCGASQKKPFCDGAHNAVGFEAT
jgi:CDGSH-type Zn-finger protein/uncharacterized Fe-S cluster protein YjdI